jgi:hypothetical protein
MLIYSSTTFLAALKSSYPMSASITLLSRPPESEHLMNGTHFLFATFLLGPIPFP